MHLVEHDAMIQAVLTNAPDHTLTKASIKCKRKMAGWDNDYLLQILLGNLESS